MDDLEKQNLGEYNRSEGRCNTFRHWLVNFMLRLRSCFTFLRGNVYDDSKTESNQDDHANHDSTHESIVDIAVHNKPHLLIHALTNGDTEAALGMIKHNSCNIYERGHFGITALHLCCIYMARRPDYNLEYLQIVRELLSNSRCDINARNDTVRTVLMYACAFELIECVDALLGHPHCKLIIRDIDGNTALHFLLRNSKDVDKTTTILRMMVTHAEFASYASVLSNDGFSAMDLFLEQQLFFT